LKMEVADRFLSRTHTVENQPPALENYNLYSTDRALGEAVRREGAAWAESSLTAFGELAGSAETIELGFLANEYRPVLQTHDRYGHWINEVRFHPAYHQLMGLSTGHGLHASHWLEPRPGANVARAAAFYLMTQVEAAHCCPITMTAASIPTLAQQPEILALYRDKILARDYDPRNLPIDSKSAITVGMAMTEKQGGSDVRANTTRAHPIGARGPGQAYELVGHKYFVSAPMCDAFLVLAQTEGGLSCFFMPRWHPDGTLNPIHILRLKNKMGNVANASSETELRGAWALMVGEEGRGVRTIIEMVAMTRFDCMVGSAAGMRQAVAQATHHCSRRSAFGRLLGEQPAMQNVLADLALEAEAAVTLAMRVARALDARAASEHEAHLVRLGTALGKYWVCKRTPGHAYEAMECIGGSGVMEDCIMPRLFRESPVNAIWEGSGNVQCLDLLRVLRRAPEMLEAYFDEIGRTRGADPRLDGAIGRLRQSFDDLSDFEGRARGVVEGMAVTWQAALLLEHAPGEVSEAFLASRLGDARGLLYGTLPPGIDCRALAERAAPSLAC